MRMNAGKLMSAILMIVVFEIFLIRVGIGQTILPQNADDIHLGVTS